MSKKTIQYTAVFNRKNKLNKEGKGLIQIEAYKDAARFHKSAMDIINICCAFPF